MVDAKSPDDIVRYTWDWSAWLQPGDQIGSVQWSMPVTYLPPPTNLITAPSSNGGSFAANQYYWVVTATNDAGETLPSNEVTATLTGSTSSVGLGWNPVVGANNYNIYRGSNTSGTPVTIDSGASGTAIGHNSGTSGTMSATCTYARGSTANYVVAQVGFLAGLTPSLLTCSYGSTPMTLLGWNVTGFGGMAWFGLSSPPTGTQTVTATVQSFGNVIGVTVACGSAVGVGSALYQGSPGGQQGSPLQTVSAVYGDLVMWGAVNVTGSSINAAMSGFNQTTLQNSGNISLPIADQIASLLGYATGGGSGSSSVSFSANVAQANIDQWWSAASLTLLPAAPPLNTLVASIPATSFQYVDTGAVGSPGSPPAASTAITSISQAASPAPSNSATTASIFLANGTAGNSYPVTCQITTELGFVKQWTVPIAVLDQ